MLENKELADRNLLDYREIIARSNGHLKLVINDKDDPRLHIIFGAFEHYNKIYFFEKQNEIFQKNILYFNSERNDWFTEPQSFLDSSSLEKSVVLLEKLIKDICNEYSCKELLFFGHSMGAYGVLIYTSLMEFALAQEIVVSCPKINLEIPSIQKNYKVSKSNKYKNLYNFTVNLNRLQDLSLKKFYFIYGEKDLLDILCVLQFKRNLTSFNNVRFTIKSFLDSDHYLLRSFKSIGYLDSIKALLSCNFEDIIGQGQLHDYMSLEDVTYLNSLNKNDEEYFLFLARLLKKYPIFFIALNRLGVKAITDNKPRLALALLQRAYRISPNDLNTNIHLAKCYERLDFIKPALVHYANCISLSHIEADKYILKIEQILSNIKENRKKNEH